MLSIWLQNFELQVLLVTEYARNMQFLALQPRYFDSQLYIVASSALLHLLPPIWMNEWFYYRVIKNWVKASLVLHMRQLKRG